MAVETENRCVNCGGACFGSSCPNRNVTVCYCDNCGDEIPLNEVYECDGMELCVDCLKSMFKKEW